MKIFREQLEIEDQCLNLAGLRKILSVAPARQGYGIDMWWVADDTPETITTHVDIYVMGTGHPMPPPLDLKNPYIAAAVDFLGTCVMSDGLVWHVFARVER